MPLHRREYLASTAAAASLVLAGCQSLLDDEPESTPASPEAGESPSPAATPTPGDGTPTDAEALERHARKFLDLLAEGEFETARGEFAAQVRSEVGVEDLRSVWEQLTAAYGRFLRVADVGHSTEGGTEVIVLVAEFETGRQEFSYTYADGELIGFFAPPGGEASEYEPPAYADESTFAERELSLDATGDCSLGATLSLPEGDGKVPGVVLVHGSGAHDRDHAIGPNRPFQDLAWGLASRGIAVLRYEKRTSACDVDLANATIDDVVTDDAVTALEALGAEDRVRDDAVFVAGLSIGATLSPRIAERAGGAAGAVMLAPAGRPVPDAMLDQTEYLLELDGELTEFEERRLAEVETMVEKIRSLDIADDEVVHLGGREYWETLTGYDHLGTAADLDIPRYLAFGERDYQVTVEDDLPLWEEVLADDPDVTVETYTDLNHLFLPGSGPPNPDEYFEPGNVDEGVVTDLTDWIADAAGA